MEEIRSSILFWSLEFVIQIILEHNIIVVWNLARSWSTSVRFFVEV